jgi:hypothetical protein
MQVNPQVVPDSIQVLDLGDAVLLLEVTEPGVKGLRFEIPLADYRDEFAVNFREWVRFVRKPGPTVWTPTLYR